MDPRDLADAVVLPQFLLLNRIHFGQHRIRTAFETADEPEKIAGEQQSLRQIEEEFHP